MRAARASRRVSKSAVVIPNFPIPFPGQGASEDLCAAHLMLNAVMNSMEDADAKTSAEIQCLFNVLCAASEKLEVIQIFLEDADIPRENEQYREARRLWVMAKSGGRS